ncbi:MAG: hypothetical protein MdMp014T_2884 [Treponematales bacterium]
MKDVFALFEKLPYSDTVVVIINVNTHISTTLALLSVKKSLDYPVLLIDCSTDQGDEYNFFKRLQTNIEFILINLPLDIHGKTLDKVFMNIKAKNVLLLDSDAEIIDASFLRNKLFDEADTFGVGFVHGPSPMDKGSMRGYKFLYYQERMYIPCVLLKREKIREAIISGCSFAAKKVYNDFPAAPFISRLLYYRFFFKFFQNHDIQLLKIFRRKYNDYFKPSMVYYDTGAEIYMYLKYKRGYDFIGLPMKYCGRYFNHYHGITRKLLNPRDANSADYQTVEEMMIERLRTEYDFDVSLV